MATTLTGDVLAGHFDGHIVLDIPAEHPALKFEQIGKALAAIVQTSPPRFAVGIFGGWGSGKSTLMDQIASQVRDGGDALVVEFNAWRYEREPHLIIPLLDTIRGALFASAASRESDADRSVVRDTARRVGRVVRALVRATSVSVGLPGAMSVSVDPGKALEELTADPTDEAANPQSLYFAAFQELQRAFADVGTSALSRIVVFVDDLDRCLPEQALAVLESMKLFFDLPGFVFVVGLDEHVVQTAVRNRFQAGEDDERLIRLEREYLKKIFQVPYSLPPMAPGQIDDLLDWMYQHCALGSIQREDLKDRVRDYLNYLAPDGRINPREIKRFINAYTLHRMIRPDLNPDTLLALQTLDFRTEWEEFYEGALLADPDLFVDVLRKYRAGDEQVFEDYWPNVGVLPVELSAFLQSPGTSLGGALVVHDLKPYVSSLETVRSSSSNTWVAEAMHVVGQLRRQIRQVAPPLRFGSETAVTIAKQAASALGRLNHGSASDVPNTRLEARTSELSTLLAELAPAGAGPPRISDTSEQELETWRTRATLILDQLYQELRLMRRGPDGSLHARSYGQEAQ